MDPRPRTTWSTHPAHALGIPKNGLVCVRHLGILNVETAKQTTWTTHPGCVVSPLPCLPRPDACSREALGILSSFKHSHQRLIRERMCFSHFNIHFAISAAAASSCQLCRLIPSSHLSRLYIQGVAHAGQSASPDLYTLRYPRPGARWSDTSCQTKENRVKQKKIETKKKKPDKRKVKQKEKTPHVNASPADQTRTTLRL
jgi:hypothetical protein